MTDEPEGLCPFGLILIIPMGNRIHVLMGENLALIRLGIHSILQRAEDMEIIGETDTVEELVRLARDLGPDIVLLDQDLPGGDWLRAIETIKEARPSAEIIVMTDQLDDQKALQAIEAGATGYILKDIPGANLAMAIRSVGNGQGYLPLAITRKLMNRLSRLVRERGWGRAKASGLTDRELAILTEVARGRSDNEIAKQFAVTEGTIKTHNRNILRKVSARNRAQAVAYVLRKGLIK